MMNRFATTYRHFLIVIYILLSIFLFSGCSIVIDSFTSDFADNLSRAMLDNDDLETVAAGGPAYLLMIDGLLLDNPDNEKLLITASKLYSQYAGAFVQENERAAKLAGKAFGFARRALCLRHKEACAIEALSYDEFSQVVGRMTKDDVPALYSLGAAWAASIRAKKNDWNAIAEIPKVTLAMEQVIALDETYEDGGAHLYLGVFNTLIPPALGGKPEVGRDHFERAMSITQGKSLMANVLYAKHYARLVFDRELHDSLLTEVLKKDPQVSGYVLINTAAQKEAQALLKSGDDYF
jgi:TRAP transporter T-component